MDRRRFLLTSLAGALAVPVAAEAQQAAESRSWGYLSSNAASLTRHFTEAFGQSLRELGWVERRRRRVSEITSEDARRIRADAEALRQKARETVKDSAQLHDQADTLARESAAVSEESRRMKRGEQPPK